MPGGLISTSYAGMISKSRKSFLDATGIKRNIITTVTCNYFCKLSAIIDFVRHSIDSSKSTKSTFVFVVGKADPADRSGKNYGCFDLSFD